MSDSSNSNKKLKSSEMEIFSRVRQYILDCPVVSSSEHPAIVAALQGLDKEIQKRERDARLQQKFMNDAVTVEKEDAMNTVSDNGNAASLSAPTAKSDNNSNDEAMNDDWQDVTSDNADETDSSFLGQNLAKDVVQTLAQHRVCVKSPIAALAVALHAALRSNTLGFACTGVPLAQKSINGFAPPIRELPSTQLLPTNWESSNGNNDLSISLRYRKNGTGSVLLKVSTKDDRLSKDSAVYVSLDQTSSSEPHPEAMQIALGEYVNLDSWTRAQKDASSASSGVSPTLHYRSLSTLLAKFSQHFDLGVVMDSSDTGGNNNAIDNHLPYIDNTLQQQRYIYSNYEQPNVYDNGFRPDRPAWEGPMGPTIDSAFPGLRAGGQQRDFAGDLLPGGLVGPHFGPGTSHDMGMLMGPNHPAFFNGGSSGGIHPGLGMRPRHDPYGPPGGPTDPNNIGRRAPPGGTGVPNPDHLPPPNGFNAYL